MDPINKFATARGDRRFPIRYRGFKPEAASAKTDKSSPVTFGPRSLLRLVHSTPNMIVRHLCARQSECYTTIGSKYQFLANPSLLPGRQLMALSRRAPASSRLLFTEPPVETVTQTPPTGSPAQPTSPLQEVLNASRPNPPQKQHNARRLEQRQRKQSGDVSLSDHH